MKAVGQRQALERHPLGATAIAMASPDLAASRGSARARLALDRYQRRAAFRPTPAGLLAGVGVGSLGGGTRFRTGEPSAMFRLRWQRLAALGRALLEVADVRDASRLRRAPSVSLGAGTVMWLGSDGDAFVEERRAELDDVLVAVLEATAEWVPWPAVRAALPGDDGDEVDDLLRSMLDDGLLHTDLVPPLVGPPPGISSRERLSTIVATAPIAEHLAEAEAALANGDWSAAQTIVGALPGSGEALHPTLVFAKSAHAVLARAGVARAAALTPLLLRLQEALAPPASERTPAPALADALDATTEIFGAGAVDLAALARGDYGVDPAEDDAAVVTAPPDRALLTFLVDRLHAAARDGATEVALRADELAPLLPDTATPPTCELFVTPCRPRAGARPGTGWLLGLHAPAGASWGRFAFALGAQADALLDELRSAESLARPGEKALDVVFAPNERLADICCHPPLRAAALALAAWPADRQPAVTVADLKLVADPAALEPLALRHNDLGPVAPSPLHRVRSTTAPPGVWRLLAGWNLYRQHAPWAATLGPLADLSFTPRLSLDGFVVAPASWRVPPALAKGRATARALAAWRRDAGVPSIVQVGLEDELLPVDLGAATAGADLTGASRVYEIWPPLGDTPDESGRRLEAVVALVDQPDADAAAAIAEALAATTSAGPVGPATAAPGDAWCTFKVFGGADQQDLVLLGALQPAVQEARSAGEISDWFFLRYVDGPGRRPHLRLRVLATDAAGEASFAQRLEHHLRPAFAAGAVVGVERAPYFPETSRYGGPAAMPAVHRLFGADSTLACALLTLLTDADDPLGLAEEPDAPSVLVACAFDALARAFERDAPARRELAARRLAAHAGGSEEAAARTADQGRAYRRLGPRLRQFLQVPPAPLGAAIARFEGDAGAAVAGLDDATRARVLPPLLHLAAIRLAGADREAEVLAYAFWERTLDSLAHHRLSKGVAPRH